MFKAIIIDESHDFIKTLVEFLQKNFPEVDIKAKITNINNAQKTIDETLPDLIISGIQFSDKKVFQVLDSLSPFNFEIIFFSNSEEDTLTAFKYGAVHYLLRPIDSDQFKIAINRAARSILQKKIKQEYEMLVANIGNKAFVNSKIAIPTSDGYVFVEIDDIIRCEANGTYTYIYTSKRDKIIASKNIKEYQFMLPKKKFFRIHNSHLINLSKISKYTKGRGGVITLVDGTELDVASRRRIEFLDLFQ
ncbi:MAG: DNA-binding response regulator [Ferruginibacter sp.]|nr:DNA-binding response regulator [Ferruginibacter sp.]